MMQSLCHLDPIRRLIPDANPPNRYPDFQNEVPGTVFLRPPRGVGDGLLPK